MSHRTHVTVNSALRILFKRGSQIGLGLGAFAPVLALANPTGGQVVSGTATISTPNANGMVIKQSTASAIIDWQQFNIGTGQYVQFLQPSSSSVVLNRVIGGGSSSILGSLTGNGQIFLVNTNGVYFGKGASVDAQGFLASTLDINNSDFLSGHYLFNKSGSDAQIVNQGNITAHKGGYVVLAGDYAENDGLIAAQSGHIVLASGTKSTLTLNGNSFVSYAINQATLSKLAGVNNAGDLEANGGTVIMTADVANLLKATVVNNTGLIEAHAISKQGGVIQLTATGGNIQNAGLLDASATTLGQQGGDITLKTDGRTTLTSKSRIIDTGDGADGGNLEVSGSTISVRGTALLGKGGHMLLDPGTMEIVAGSGTSHIGSAGNTTSTGSIGVNFIQKQLNQGDAVTIQATHVIDASANVHAITAKGKGGLDLMADGGKINLSGVNLAIGGELTASMQSGSFGFIQAGSVDLHASGDIRFHAATLSKTGAITKYSVRTTGGDLDIHAAAIGALHSSSKTTLALNANGTALLSAEAGTSSHRLAGNLTLQGKSVVAGRGVAAAGNVAISAGTGGFSLDNGIGISAGKNLSINGAVHQDHSHSMSLTAGGNLTLSGGLSLGQAFIGSGTSAVQTAHNLDLQAGGTITVGGAIKAAGSVDIIGKKLAYTGKTGTLSIEADDGNLTLDATIGSANARVAYGVKLTGKDDLVQVERSIFTKGAIAVTDARDSLGGGNLRVGNSSSMAMTLSALKAITLSGGNVGIGGNAAVTITADDGNTTVATDDLNITATSGGVRISGADAAVSNETAATETVDHSVTLRAGHDVRINAVAELDVSGGSVKARTGDKGGALSVIDTVSITAGNDIALQARSLDLAGGRGRATVNSDSHLTASATAATGVTLTAGHDIDVTVTQQAFIGAGTDSGFALAQVKNQKTTATVTSGVTLSAGHDVTIGAGSLRIFGGNGPSVSMASGVQAVADASGAAATVTRHADVSVKAGDAIGLTASFVEIDAGRNVGGPLMTHHHVGASSTIGFLPTRLDATGKGAAVTLTDTGDVSLTAGKGGIAVSAAKFLDISGGDSAARGLREQVDGSGGKATGVVQSSVTLTATGALNLKGGQIALDAGSNAAGRATDSSHTHSGATKVTHFGTNVRGDHDDVLSLSVDSGLHFKAGGSANISAAKRLIVEGGSDALQSASIHLGSATAKGSVQVSVDSGISVAAGAKLNIKGSSADLRGAFGGAQGAGMFGSAGTVKVALTGGLSLAAGKGMTLQASKNGIDFDGGSSAAKGAMVTAEHKGKASLTVDESVSLVTTTGAISFGVAGLAGGSGAGMLTHVNAESGGSAALSVDAGISVKAGSVISATGIRGGNSAGAQAQVTGSHGKATLSAQAGVDVTATTAVSLTLADGSGGGISIEGGRHAGSAADVTSLAGGTATESAGAGVDVSVTGATGTITLDIGKQPKGRIQLTAGIGDANGADVAAAAGGTAALTVDAGVGLSAKGAVKISGSSAQILEIGTAGSNAKAAKVDADGKAAKSALDLQAGVSIKGGSIAVNFADAPLSMSGGGFGVGSGAEVSATSAGATAALTGNIGSALTATGAITLDAQRLFIDGGKAGFDAVLVGKTGGKANATLTANQEFTAGGAITINVAQDTDLKAFHSFSGIGFGAHVTASTGAAVKLEAQGDIGFNAGGNFNLTGGSSIQVRSGGAVGAVAHTSAQGKGAVATTDLEGAISITAANITINNAAHGLVMSNSDDDGLHAQINGHDGGVATMDVAAGVRLTATKNIALNTIGLILGVGAQGGHSAGGKASSGGKVNMAIDAGIDILAGGAVSLDLNDQQLLITTGDDIGGDVTFSAFSNQSAVKLSIAQNITIKAAGALTLSEVNGVTLDAAHFGGASIREFIGGTASLLVDSSINLLGKTLTAQVTGTFHSISTIATPVPGITENTSINVTGGIAVLQPPAPAAITAPAPAALGALHQGALLMNLETVLAAPDASQQTGSAGCNAKLVQSGHCLIKD